MTNDLKEITIIVRTVYDDEENNPEDYSVHIEFTHDGHHDSHVHVYRNSPQFREIDLTDLLVDYVGEVM